MSQEIQLHGGNLLNEAKRLGCRPDQILDASSSLVPFPINNSLRRCLIKSLDSGVLNIYPDRDHLELRESIAHWHKVNPDMVFPGNGAAELFNWVARDASCLGLSSLPSPGFADYSRALRCWHGAFSYESLPKVWSAQRPQCFPLRPKSDVLWITNPHNPTGQLWSRESIENLAVNYKLVICDEAFLPLVPDGEYESVIPLIENHPNLVVVRSLTKLFALPGLRLGYAIAHPERLEVWKKWRDPWPLNAFAIDGGIHLMSNIESLENWVRKVHSWVKTEGYWLHQQLDEMSGIIPHPSTANFLLIKGDKSLLSVIEKMAQRRILLRDCRSFLGLGENWVRIGLKERKGNRRIVNNLKICLNN